MRKLSAAAQRVLSDLSSGGYHLMGYSYGAGITRYSMIGGRRGDEYSPHPAMIARLIRLGYLTPMQPGQTHRITEEGRMALKASRA